MTNLEHLAACPEELARIIHGHDDCCDYCTLDGGCVEVEDCEARILEWLMAERE